MKTDNLKCLAVILTSICPKFLNWNTLTHQYCPRDVGYPYACDRSTLESWSALTQCRFLSCPLYCSNQQLCLFRKCERWSGMASETAGNLDCCMTAINTKALVGLYMVFPLSSKNENTCTFSIAQYRG